MKPSPLLYTEQRCNKSFLYKKQKLLFINSNLQPLALLWKEQKVRLGCEVSGVHQMVFWVVGWFKRGLGGEK